MEMRFFKRKKKEEEREFTYEIFGGAVITEVEDGYEITWKSPNLTSIRLTSPPEIDKDVMTEKEGNSIRILTRECKLKVVMSGREVKASISKI